MASQTLTRPAALPPAAGTAVARLPLVLLVGGVSLCLAAVLVGRSALNRAIVAPAVHSASGPSAPAQSPGRLVLTGPGDVSVVTQVYESGQSSGWHSHSGLHAVAVLSGRLAVYDQDCRLQQVEPGQPYVGGQELHLVRNEGTEPATMIVTYLNPAQPAPARAPSPAPPPNCPVP